MIPSKQLEFIHLQGWDEITNKDISNALYKWDLKELRLSQCPKIQSELFKE